MSFPRTKLRFLILLSCLRYGGPGSQDVSNRWGVEWDHYLASARDFVVAHMDVRGTGFAGNSFKQAVYRRLGSVEVDDTLHVIRYHSTLGVPAWFAVKIREIIRMQRHIPFPPPPK